MIDPINLVSRRISRNRAIASGIAIKRQLSLDKKRYFSIYNGYISSTGKSVIKSLSSTTNHKIITNGLIVPGEFVRLIGTTIDQIPAARPETENYDTTKKNSIEVTKEVVGSADIAESFDINLKLNEDKERQIVLSQLTPLSEIESPAINQAKSIINLRSSIKKYEPIEKDQKSHYLSIKLFKKLEDVSGMPKQAKCYLCNCKPRIIFKFVSSPSARRWDLSRFFLSPNPTLVRTRCETLLEILRIKDDSTLVSCKNAVRWRLVEVGASGSAEVGYGAGIVLEDGRLSGSLNNSSYVFTSTYDYPGYMQLQVGCYSLVKKGVLWK